MNYVFDCSFSAAFILPDEENREIARVYNAITKDDRVFVPQLWWYEMPSVLKKTVLMKRFEYGEVERFIMNLDALNVTTDAVSGAAYSRRLLTYARDYQLSAYDAVYLDLALRKRAALCTLDDALAGAARRAGLVVAA